jgi:hypothetical protein
MNILLNKILFHLREVFSIIEFKITRFSSPKISENKNKYKNLMLSLEEIFKTYLKLS